jgi:hypothetical protein
LSAHEGDGDFEVKAGDRMPYFLVDGKSIYDKLREPKFHLLTFSDGEIDYSADNPRVHEIESNNLLDRFVLPLYPHVAEIFGTDKSFHVLLRPDNYIGSISSDVSSDRVAAYLKKVSAETGAHPRTDSNRR